MVTLEQRLKAGCRADMWLSGREFWAGGAAEAQALRQECAWCVHTTGKAGGAGVDEGGAQRQDRALEVVWEEKGQVTKGGVGQGWDCGLSSECGDSVGGSEK